MRCRMWDTSAPLCAAPWLDVLVVAGSELMERWRIPALTVASSPDTSLLSSPEKEALRRPPLCAAGMICECLDAWNGMLARCVSCALLRLLLRDLEERLDAMVLRTTLPSSASWIKDGENTRLAVLLR